jgi:hypothetical protein
MIVFLQKSIFTKDIYFDICHVKDRNSGYHAMEQTLRNEKTTEEVALGIRRRVFEHSIRNNGGYMSQACSAAEQLAWLYNEELNLGAPTDDPETVRGCAP